MHNAHDFLLALTIVLCTAAVTTVIFQRLRQPVVLGYILAGIIIGPHVPVPLVADPAIVRTLSEVGVILLMFSLGLEFSLRKLVRVGPMAALTALVETTLMMWLGFTVAQAFGWSTVESMFTGAVVAISSTTIVAKAFEEQRVSGRLREIVVGVLVVEDLIAILLMATLTAVATGSGLDPGPLARTIGRLGAFLVGLVAVGMLVIPRAVRYVNRLNRPETTIIAAIGLCFSLALLAQYFGYSVALGAFIAGSLVAESGEEKQVEHLVLPVRDVFAAVFFVSVGMLIDPQVVARNWAAVLLLGGVVVVGKIIGVSLGAFLTGNRLRTSIESGMSLAQIGEFSFIIAGLGLSLHATGEFLYPTAIAISAGTTLTTPWLIRASGPVSSWIDRKLPRPLQTFTVLYGSWVEGLTRASRPEGTQADIRRLLRRLLLDASLFTVIVVGFSSSRRKLVAWGMDVAGLPDVVAFPLLVLTATALAAPFFFGVIRVGRKFGAALAEVVLPAPGAGSIDLADAPRRLLVASLEIVIVIMVGVPLLTLTRPFLPGAPLHALIGLLILVLCFAFWRSARNLEGHVRAGAEVIVAALAKQSRGGEGGEDGLKHVEQMMPGLGSLTAVRLGAAGGAVGKTLAEIDLRAVTGASVLALTREGGDVVVPTARERLRSGDLVALTGTQEAIEAARRLLEPEER
jgi:monovalent cation:H+ antiporter-2, CPA2 family